LHLFDKGHTSLTNACARNDYEAVVAQLERGSNPNESSDAGDLPLDIAAMAGSSRVIEALLKFGAKSQRAVALAEANGHFVSAALIRKYISVEET
jgi:ankyrin repeat protein